MAFRCSLLGHDYGDAEVEREREERGSEVVVTVQEYEECARCGERNVISENTEVTSISAETDADALPDESELESDATATPDSGADAVEPAADAAAESGTELEYDGADDAELIDDDGDDAELVDDETDVGAGQPEPDPVDTGADAGPDDEDLDVPTDEHGEPVTDDGEILEDDGPTGDDRDRDHGEWPDSEDVGPPVGSETDHGEWPDSGDRPDGAIDPAADEVDDDAVVLENDTGSTGGESAAAADARSVTADPPSPETRDASGDATWDGSDGDPDPGTGTGIERADAAPNPVQSGGTSRDDVPTEFYCPKCDYVESGDRGSLRAGDICPECRKGYLGERELR